VSTALEGGTGAFAAVRRLGLADQPVVVLALAVAEQAELARLADGLAMHLSALHPRCAAAPVGDVAYGLIPVMLGSAASADGGEGELRAVRIATDFLDRVGDRSGPVIGIGQVAFDAAGLPAARACADRALRVLRSGAGSRAAGTGRRVARLADVHAESLLMELRDLAAAHGDRPTGPVARLSAYDLEHGANLVETLRAWLDAFGDVTAASAAMFVHPNTFRYRLRRLTEVSAIDLTDPEQRFAAMLQLRAVYPADREPAGRLAASRLPPSGLAESDLLGLQGGVPEGGDGDELIALPLAGLAEVEVERLSRRGDHRAVGQRHFPGEGSGGAGDHGDPVAAPELDRVRIVVDADVGEDAEHLRHHRGVGRRSVDRLCVAGDVRDHVGVVDLVQDREVAVVEGVVALFHEREEVCRPAGVGGSHEGSCSCR
jgi:hypothetical protein